MIENTKKNTKKEIKRNISKLLVIFMDHILKVSWEQSTIMNGKKRRNRKRLKNTNREKTKKEIFISEKNIQDFNQFYWSLIY